MPRGFPLGNFLAAVAILVVLVLVVLVLGVLVVLVVLIVLIVLILISILVVIHLKFLRFVLYGITAIIACPENQDLSFALNRIPASRPAMIAAVIPPAVAFNPPIRIPIKPFS